MATYSWPDGSKNHTISWTQHLQNKGITRTTGPEGTTYINQAALKGVLGNAPATPPTPDGNAAAAASSNPGFEAMFNADTNANTTSYKNDIAGYQYGENQAGSDYGFQIQRDPTTGYVNTDASLAAVDPNNPFSKMALLSRSYQQEQSGNLNSYAAQGQHNSGAYNRQVANAQFNNEQGKDTLKKAFADVVNKSTLGRNASANTLAANNTSSAANRLNNYLGQ